MVEQDVCNICIRSRMNKTPKSLKAEVVDVNINIVIIINISANKLKLIKSIFTLAIEIETTNANVNSTRTHKHNSTLLRNKMKYILYSFDDFPVTPTILKLVGNKM